MKTGEGRSDYQDVRVCDVNSNSDVSMQQKRELNTHLRKLKNKQNELKILRESNEAGAGQHARMTSGDGSSNNHDALQSRESIFF